MSRDIVLEKTKLLEQKSCPICSSNGTTIDRVATIHPYSDITLDLLECDHCKHWWSNPIPTQELLNDLYQKGSEYVVPKNYAASTPAIITTYDKKLWNKIFKASTYHFKMKGSVETSFSYLEIGISSGCQI